VSALIGLKAHVEHALRPEGFYFRVRLGTFERHAIAPGGLPKWDGPTRLTGEFGENSPHLYRGVLRAKSLQEFSTLVHWTSYGLADLCAFRVEPFAFSRRRKRLKIL
jgi:hypothetical protein